MMSSLANTILFIALVTTSVMVAVMYWKLRRLDQYHEEYQQIFDKTGEALLATQNAVINFGAESQETLALLSNRIEEAREAARHLEVLTRSIHELPHSRPRA